VKEAVIFAASKVLSSRLSNYQTYLDLFRGKAGIEIGGPSDYFRAGNILPIYPVLRSLDGVNFSSNTMWEGTLTEGLTFDYDSQKQPGFQFIRDAVNLENLPAEKYEFLIACNSLEHIANPFRALTQWLRVIKPGGLLFLVLPNKTANFDHRRQVTTLEHLVDDFENATGEDDLTHLDEILALHDLTLDPEAGTLLDFRARASRNHENRALHHHVFDLPLLIRIFEHFRLEVLVTSKTLADYYVVGRKT